MSRFGSLSVYREPASLRMLFLGFSSGLPLLLVLGTLSFWLRESGIDLKTIGFMSWVGLCWGLKWVWAPLVDRLRIPLLTRRLGRRRAWLLLSQIGLAAGLAAMAFCDPAKNLDTVIACALVTAFFGATQDISLDAFRIESGNEKEQAAFAAMYQTGYRFAMLWSGAGALAIAAAFDAGSGEGWRIAYLVMAASLLTGIVTVLVSPEPQVQESSGAPARRSGVKAWLREAVWMPFADFSAVSAGGPWLYCF